MNASVDTGELRRFEETLRRWLSWRKGNVKRLLAERALSLVRGSKGAPGLYQLTRAEAPSPERILADARGRGWRVRRGGSPSHRATVARHVAGNLEGNTSVLGRAVVTGKGFLTVEVAKAGAHGQRVSKESRRAGMRAALGKVRGGVVVPGNIAGRSELRNRVIGGRLTGMGGMRVLNRRHLEVIWDVYLRQRASGHAALGWLSLRKDGREGAVAATVVRAVGRIGYAVIEGSKDGARAEIHNAAEGMGKLDKRRGIVRRALVAQRRDMLDYIARKEAEAAKNFFRGNKANGVMPQGGGGGGK